jgi:hypothetical protein
MTCEIQIPHAWRIIIEGDASPKHFYVLTALPEHPHTFGFDASAKRELLDAVAAAAATHVLDAFHVLWEITPALCTNCRYIDHASAERIDCLTAAGFETTTCIPSLTDAPKLELKQQS